MVVSNTIIKNIELFQTSIKLQKISSVTNVQCVEGSAEQSICIYLGTDELFVTF